jgi:hypothetical protein
MSKEAQPMPDWRKLIVKEFIPEIFQFVIVADPDMLLLEERILQEIREKGFELYNLEDMISFRFAYETRFRAPRDNNEEINNSVVLRCSSGDMNRLPYDLLRSAHKLSFSVADIFPTMSYPVVASLERNNFDALYQAQLQQNPGKMGDNATKDFILRHVFSIAPELIKQPSDLLRTLLQYHYQGYHIPPQLEERLIYILRHGMSFSDWPLEQIVPDKTHFLAFIQERWPVFLNAYSKKLGKKKSSARGENDVYEDLSSTYGLKYSGPAYLPLDHQDVHIYLDNLFNEGLLRPVDHENSEVLAESWASAGVRSDPREDRQRRLEALYNSVRDTLPTSEARHNEWFHFARRWAELLLLQSEVEDKDFDSIQFKTLRDSIDTIFLPWLLRWYRGLHNLPPIPPVMLHHIPRFLESSLSSSSPSRPRHVLILMDGLSLDQWIVIREVIVEQQPLLVFQEDSIFAWAPTITSVSRQTVFAGKLPFFFPSSIYDNNKETLLWNQLWLDKGFSQKEIIYCRSVNEDNIRTIKEALSSPSIRIAGMIIDKVDKITHGMMLGTAGMHNQVRQWARQGFFVNLLEYLLDEGFMITITSDHGNVESTGYGRPLEGALANIKGERVRIFPDKNLRNQVKSQFPDSIEWPSIGLPDNFIPLIASGRNSFINKGEKSVTHGGVSLEELIVPFIQVRRRAQ